MRSSGLAPHHLAVEATSVQRTLLPSYLTEGKLPTTINQNYHHY